MSDVAIARDRAAGCGGEDGSISSAAVAGIHARTRLLIASEFHFASWDTVQSWNICRCCSSRNRICLSLAMMLEDSRFIVDILIVDAGKVE